MKYAVHLYPTVRVKVIGIEANSTTEAAIKAASLINLHDVLDDHRPIGTNVEIVEWDEGENNFVLVDPLDDGGNVIDGSQWLNGSGEPLVDGKTPIERKAAAFDQATLFMEELLESVETLSSIAEVHGVRTLADLMYVQSAILTGGFIDHWPLDSAAMDIANGLPSGKQWAKFFKKEYMGDRETAGA
jgi:hypothetical protein